MFKKKLPLSLATTTTATTASHAAQAAHKAGWQQLGLALLLTAAAGSATAQGRAQAAPAPAPAVAAAVAAAAPLPAPLQLQASHLSGEAFSMKQIQGRVAVVFFWSTSCAVCRDTLPELRANLDGWRGKPISLLQVNVDKQAEDWQAYERIRSQMHKPAASLLSLYQDASLSPPKLPLTLVVDRQGRVVHRYEGRIAPEAWNDVADLLP